MASALQEGGYVSWKADPDVWTRSMTKPNGDTYLKYACVMTMAHSRSRISPRKKWTLSLLSMNLRTEVSMNPIPT